MRSWERGRADYEENSEWCEIMERLNMLEMDMIHWQAELERLEWQIDLKEEEE